MTFKEWLFSSYPNPEVNNRWGLMHILLLLSSIGIIVLIARCLRHKSYKARRITLFVLAGLILFFEITRRVINFIKATNLTFQEFLSIMLPRPWCAISCWALILAVLINKKFFYNFASYTSLLCAITYFSYPGAGINNQYMLFENVYSIITHALLLITSISMITLKFTDFRYKNIWKELICYAGLFGYALFEVYVLHIADDPMYFMPNNDIINVLGLPYGLFLFLYILVVALYTNAFYAINDRRKSKNTSKTVNATIEEEVENIPATK